MRITRLNGLNITADAQTIPDKVEAAYMANVAILAGSPVIIDTADTTGYKVKLAAANTAAQTSLLVGIYEGIGGTGAAAGTGFTGKAAIANDSILVTVYGKAIASVIGAASVTAGSRCNVEGSGATAGSVLAVANAVAGENYAPIITLLEAYTTATAAAKSVFVRAL